MNILKLSISLLIFSQSLVEFFQIYLAGYSVFHRLCYNLKSILKL